MRFTDSMAVMRTVCSDFILKSVFNFGGWLQRREKRESKEDNADIITWLLGRSLKVG